ncbi:MAG TPA: hypothetical protein DCP61_01210 [Treponema sp.]|nr:hypothetical protein [Treponema sp.]
MNDQNNSLEPAFVILLCSALHYWPDQDPYARLEGRQGCLQPVAVAVVGELVEPPGNGAKAEPRKAGKAK